MGSAGLFTYVYVCMHMHKYVYMYVYNNNNQWEKGYQAENGEDMRDVQHRVSGRGWREKGEEGPWWHSISIKKIKTLGFITAKEAIQDFLLLECLGNLSKHSEKQGSHQPLVQLLVISSFRGHQRHTEKEDQRLSASKLATPSRSCCLIPQPTWLFPTRWTSNFTCSVGKQEGDYSRDSSG